MSENLSIDNLHYEELIMLQEILISIDSGVTVSIEDYDTFESLYEKVMSS